MTPTRKDLGFIHEYLPPTGGDSRTLLMLHGTGGDEHDLLGLGREIAPGAGLLSPRGKVLEGGAARFFRRFAEGVFDVKDVAFRAGELARFIEDAATAYHFDPSRVVAVGYSNGANIAAAVLLLHPPALAGAVLFRPMLPITPETAPNLSRAKVLIRAGTQDPICRPEAARALGDALATMHGDVHVQWAPTGHGLLGEDVSAAERWIAESFPA